MDIQHTFTQVSPHCYMLSPHPATDRPLLGLIAGRGGALLVDAGNSSRHARLMLGEIAKRGLASPTFLMFTHWHWDHVFGAQALNLQTFAHRETRRILTVMAGLDWSDAALDLRVADGRETASCRDNIKAELPDRSGLVIRPPDISYDSGVELHLDGVSCQIVHVGGDHSPDESVVYVPEDKVVFLGDCLSKDFDHGPRRYTTAELFPLLDRLLSFEADLYFESHTPLPIPRSDLAAEAGVLKTIGRVVERLAPDRQAVLSALPGLLKTGLNQDHIEDVDAFFAGLRLPVVRSML